jgi:predicted anti-sigma-YlaC factor YlaD
MLRCRDVAELMSDYLDGTVGWRRRLSIRLHLMMCGMCRRYMRQMRATIALLRSLALPGDSIDRRDA